MKNPAGLALACGAFLLAACGGGQGAATEQEFAATTEDLSSSCAGLVPGAPGAGFLKSLATSENEICLGGASTDGLGNVQVSTFDTFADEPNFTIFTPAGSRAGGFAQSGLSVLPQASGWEGMGGGGTFSWVSAFSHTGAGLRTTVVDKTGSWTQQALDYGGGILVVRAWFPSAGHWQLTAQRFTSTGAARSAPAIVAAGLGNNVRSFGGVSLNGHSLVLWNDGSTSSTFRGRWLDRSGNPLTPAFTAITGITTQFPFIALRPLYDNSLAARVGTHWTRQFPDASTAARAAPGWLSSRPGTEIELIRGGRGYAMWANNSCSRTIGIHAQTGATCGSVVMPSGCGFTVGRDGTVLATAGGGCVFPPAGPVCHCDTRWWTRLLH